MERLINLKESAVVGARNIRNNVFVANVPTFDDFISQIPMREGLVVKGKATKSINKPNQAADGDNFGVRLEGRMENGRKVRFHRTIGEAKWGNDEREKVLGLVQARTLEDIAEPFREKGMVFVFEGFRNPEEAQTLVDTAKEQGIEPLPFKRV